MKQTIFMAALLVVCLPWSLLNPFVGLAAYYGLALLRPQDLWASLVPNWRYSFIVAGVALAGYVINGFARKSIARRWTIEKILMGVFAVMATLSFLNARNYGLAAHRFGDLAKILLMFFVACGLIDSKHRLRILSIAIVVAVGWLAVDFNQKYLLFNMRSPGVLRLGQLDNNIVAAIMVLAMPFCVFLFATERKWYLRWPPLAAMMLMVHFVMFSMSRGGMLGTLVAIPLVLFRLKRRQVGIVLGVVMLAVAIRLAGPMVHQRFFSIQQYEEDGSAQARLDAWGTATQVIADNPLLGVGPLGFAGAADEYAEGRGGRVHNQFLQTAADMGIPAAMALAGVILASLYHLQVLRHRTFDNDPFLYDLAGCLQASLASFVAVGMFLTLDALDIAYLVMAMTVGLRNVASATLLEPVKELASAKAVKRANAPTKPVKHLTPNASPATT